MGFFDTAQRSPACRQEHLRRFRPWQVIWPPSIRCPKVPGIRCPMVKEKCFAGKHPFPLLTCDTSFLCFMAQYC